MRGAPWLHLSSLGIGTYLGDADDATDVEASTPPLLRSGCLKHTGNWNRQAWLSCVHEVLIFAHMQVATAVVAR